MYSALLLALGSAALVKAQTTMVGSQIQAPALPPTTLTTTQSGVLPIIPTETPFTGLLLNEGAIIMRGPVRPGFVGPGGNATAQTSQPSSTLQVTLPTAAYNPYFGTTPEGTVTAVGGADGVAFTVNLTNLPPLGTYGPFMYHIHTLPVPSDGNCTATLSHLDPTNRGELYLCDMMNPQSCQTGDLTGKHGSINQTDGSYSATYVDPYLSVDPSSPYYFGGLAFVLHSNNATRITCANFVSSTGETPVANGTNGTATMSMSPTMSMAASATSSGPAQFTGAAAKVEAGALGLVAAGLAFLL